SWSQFAAYNNYFNPGYIPSVFLKQALSGGGYYFRQTNQAVNAVVSHPETMASYQQALPAGFTDYSGHAVTVGVSSITVQTTRSTPGGIYVAYTTDDRHVPIFFADTFVGATVVDDTPAGSAAYHAVSVDGRQTWVVWIPEEGGGFRSIVQNAGGTWEYKDDTDAWIAASTNNLATALQEAFGVVENRMTGDTLNAMTSDNWATDGGVVPKITQYLDFAVGLQADGSGNVPSVTSYSATYNDTGTVIIEGFTGGMWTPGSGFTDGTQVNGVPLAQSGIITYNGAAGIMLDYAVVSEVPGYHIRLRPNGTAPGTAITRILYKAPCQALANIGDGQPDIPNGFVYWDVSEDSVQDWTSEVSDNTYSEFSIAPIPMDTDDYLYVGFYNQFNTVEWTPWTDNNQVVSTLSMEYWAGSSWKSLPIVDGTAGASGNTLALKGKISWTLPTDWKMNIPFNAFLSRAYWVRFKVSVALTPTTAISECRVYSVPTALKKHKFVALLDNTVALGNRPDAPDQVDISRPLEEYGFCGALSGSYRVGGPDAIQAVCSAWNSLFVWKTETCHQITAGGNGYTVNSVEAARHVPVNSRCIVKAPVSSPDGDKYGLFFINRFGAFVSTGLHTDALWNTSRGRSLSDALSWWDANSTPRLDLNYLHLACGEYWPVKNWIVWSAPMIVSGTVQTTNNRLIVYDLNLRAWLPPFTISVASLTAAYHYGSDVSNRIGEIGLYGGDYSGRILRLFPPGVTTDTGEPVNSWAETGWLHFGSPEFMKMLRLVSIHGKTVGGPVRIVINTDGDTSALVNLTFDDIATLGEKLFLLEQESNNVQGRFFKFTISFSGAGEIYGIQIGVSTIREWGAM
ncbi:MAG TPA: hypothetical protein VK463_05825, partial [Desulfomonilaceae bacterium]|nr:hypothetical protein [Desulfomonilaceae bacterium]